jgi:hypothetical protein
MEIAMEDIPSIEFLVQYVKDHGREAEVQHDGYLRVQDSDGLWRTIPATFRAVRGYLGE